MSQPYSSTELLQSVEQLLSGGRLARYRQPAGDDLSVLVTYCWNVQLSEALVPPLHFVETALRNSLNRHLTNVFDRTDWYDTPGFLLTRQARARDAAIKKIENDNHSVVPGRVIAALSFGFWVDILSGGYSKSSHPLGIWDHRAVELARVFPYASPQDLASRRQIDARFRAMRDLRNRIFHYECIYDDAQLAQKYDSIIESIGWINPAMHLLIRTIDRFSGVYRDGYRQLELLLRHQLLGP